MGEFVSAPIQPVKVFVSCPGDVKEEKVIIEEILRDLNETVAKDRNLQLELRDWEKDVPSGIATDIQTLVFKEIGDYDIYLGLLWHKLGTKTPRAESGTVEEYQDAHARHTEGSLKRLMFFFREPKTEVITTPSGHEEYGRVIRFRGQLQSANVMYRKYLDVKDFAGQLKNDLITVVRGLRKVAASEPAEVGAERGRKAIPRAPGEVRTGDRALTISTMGAIDPPPGFSTWRAAGFEADFHGPESRPANLNEILRLDTLDMGSWNTLLSEAKETITSCVNGARGGIHVYLKGNHPLAMWVGHRLRERDPSRELVIHQFMKGNWKPFLSTSYSIDREILPFFGDVEPVNFDGKGNGTVLFVSAGGSAASDADLVGLAKRAGASSIRHLKPRVPGQFIETSDEAQSAAESVATCLRRIRVRTEGAPIHLATTAPVALMIAVGHLLPASVFGDTQLYVWQYLPESKTYQLVLELFSGKVIDRLRPSLLRIFSADGGGDSEKVMMYELDGKLLPSARRLPLSLEHVEGTATDLPALFSNLQQQRRQLIPETVEDALRRLPSLDVQVEVRLDPPHANWELLHLPSIGLRDGMGPRPDTEEFGEHLVCRPGWSLHRAPVQGRLDAVKCGQRPLKVMIVPAIRRDEAAAQELAPALDTLQKQLEEQGVSVTRLTWLPSLASIREELKRIHPDIVHWVGHGGADADQLWPSVVEAEQASAQLGVTKRQLVRAFRDAPPRLLVLGACRVGQSGEGFGVPEGLLGGGVGAVIAFREEVSTGVVSAFSETLYAAILAKKTIGDAVREARIRISLEFGHLPAALGVPALFTGDRANLDPLVGVPLPIHDPTDTSDPGAVASPQAPGGYGSSLPIHDGTDMTDPGIFSTMVTTGPGTTEPRSDKAEKTPSDSPNRDTTRTSPVEKDHKK